MEALLSLPVVMTVLVLLFNFSSAVIQKSRATVAVREIAFRHMIDASANDAVQSRPIYDATWGRVRSDVRRRGWAGYSFDSTANLDRGFMDLTGHFPGGSKNDVALKPEGGDDGGFMNAANSFLSSLVGQRDFTVRLSAEYPFQGARAPGATEPIFSGRKFEARLVIDSSPWTEHELPCGWVGVLVRTLKLPTQGPVNIAGWLGCGSSEVPFNDSARYDKALADTEAQEKADKAAAEERARKRAEEKARKEEEARQAAEKK